MRRSNQSNSTNRSTTAAALRREAVRARANSEHAGRPEVDRARDLHVAKSFEGLADNRDYLDKQN
jgi:hypothetical protein